MSQDIWSRFRETLNRHGYGFQYSVLNLAKEVSAEGGPWKPLAVEFPVQVQGSPTRIDIILQYRHSGLFMVVECKRPDPRFSDWCFAKAPSVKDPEPTEHILSDHLVYHDMQFAEGGVSPSAIFTTLAKLRWPNTSQQEDYYHIGRPVKGSERGQSGQSGHDDIEKAATQACRGSNGLIELARKNPELVAPFSRGGWQGLIVLPAIFTTAQIWACACDLGASRLEDGTVELSREDCSEQPCLFLQYPVSPGIKHSVSRIPFEDHGPLPGLACQSQKPFPETGFAQVLQDEYIRTIPIVTATGIKDFLSTFNVEPH